MGYRLCGQDRRDSFAREDKKMKKFVFTWIFVFLLTCGSAGQSLFPNQDAEALYDKVLARLNSEEIGVVEAGRYFEQILDSIKTPSGTARAVHGPHLWKLAVQRDSAWRCPRIASPRRKDRDA